MSEEQKQKELKQMNQCSDSISDEFAIRIERWKHTRFWAVWLNQELLAVVLYKKGAVAVRNAILGLQQRYSGQWGK